MLFDDAFVAICDLYRDKQRVLVSIAGYVMLNTHNRISIYTWQSPRVNSRAKAINQSMSANGKQFHMESRKVPNTLPVLVFIYSSLNEENTP